MCQHPANRRLSVRLLKGSFHLIVGMSQQCPPIWMPSKTHFAISEISERMSCEEYDLIGYCIVASKNTSCLMTCPN